ncbi:hypothetical protein DPX16_8152 [Anabarilius grahami]|uniref:Uncharacterized protein n=1 Tax=Anabarilius grahami TaxID=495550 RepID=A0A3N0Y8B3_ANAGA|nr:hypothetical protein DPX16_8152 [Anabarilius grahami]
MNRDVQQPLQSATDNLELVEDRTTHHAAESLFTALRFSFSQKQKAVNLTQTRRAGIRPDTGFWSLYSLSHSMRISLMWDRVPTRDDNRDAEIFVIGFA